MKKLFPQSLKNVYHLFQAILANLIYGFPGRKIRVIGITGTNGKTTTSQMVAKILERNGSKVALASTINFRIGGQEWVNVTKMTTLSSFKVQSFLSRSVRQGCGYAVLEVSSHSLDQNRVWGIPFHAAIITNITREHLDYHGTMERYRQAKRKLFKKTKIAVVNLDLEKPEDFLSENLDKAYYYSVSNKSPKIKAMVVQAENIRLFPEGSDFRIKNESWEENFHLNIPGKFNIENALAAICIGISENMSAKKISEALSEIKLVPGRMESVPNKLGLNIIIDYAVTPDSLEKLYSYVLETKKFLPLEKGEVRRTEGLDGQNKSFKSSSSSSFSKGGESRVIAVFGSCGERDRGKRPLMGEIVSKTADFVIVTNEDPYGEDPWQIINEVAGGVKNKKEGENFWKIFDRRDAIRKALELARSGDTVLVTGKGAEETMAIGKERIPWNDKKVILEELEKIKKAP